MSYNSEDEANKITNAYRSFVKNRSRYTAQEIADGEMAFAEYFKLANELFARIDSEETQKLLKNFDLATNLLHLLLVKLKLIN